MENLQLQLSVPVHALGWAILHSLWQGLLLYVLLRITFRFAPRASARFRYNISLAAMSGLFLWFAYTLVRYWENLRAYTIIVTRPVNGVVKNDVIRATTTTDGGDYVAHLYDMMPWLEGMFPILVTVYLGGILFFASRFTYHFIYLRGFRTRGVSQPGADALDKMYEWKERLGIAQKVRLLFSDRIDVPMMIGAVKPVILVPLATFAQLSPDQFEAILIHELAHIKRRDYLINIIQSCLETILFFNPFMWLISSLIRQEREHCCDDMVVQYTTHPLSYAKALTALEAHRLNPLALAATGNKNQLLNRIKRMMEMKKQTPASAFLPALLVFIGLTVSLLWLSPALAQSKKEKEKEEQTSATGKDKEGTNKSGIVIIDDNGNKRTYNSVNDMPPSERRKLREMLDEVETKTAATEKDIAEAMKEVERSMKEIDREKMNKEIKEAMEEANKAMEDVDWNQINDEIKQAMKESEKAMKEVDWEEINKEIKEAMAESKKAVEEIDWNEINREVSKAMKESKKAMKEVDWQQINKEINTAMAAVNFDSLGYIISAAVDSAVNVSIASTTPKGGKANQNVWVITDEDDDKKKGSPRSSSSTSSSYSFSSGSNTKVSTSSGYGKMLDKMEKEGLINRSEPYRVEKKNDQLYINGKKQSSAVYDKYSKYLDAEKITIDGDDGMLNVNVKN